MPTNRILYGITYYPVKRDYVTYCIHCGKKFPIIAPVYAKGTADSAEILCKDCLTELSDRYQYEQYGRVPFPGDAPLYIGLLGHTCSASLGACQTIQAIFRRKEHSTILSVHCCPQCKRFYLDQQSYQNNSRVLSGYTLIHSITGKQIPGSKCWGIQCKSAPGEDPQFPASVIWSYLHPFQGGGCTGK